MSLPSSIRVGRYGAFNPLLRKPILFLGFLFLSAALRAQPKVTLELQPSSVEVAPWYGEVEFRAVLQNAGSTAAVKPALFAFTNDSFAVEIEPAAVERVDPNESFVWTVRVKRLENGRIPGSILLDATYTIRGKPRTQHTYASLAIKASEAGSDKPVEVSVQGSFDAISQHHPGTGYLLVNNNLDVPVKVPSVTISTPDEAGINKNKTEPFEVPPHSSAQRPIVLDSAGEVTPGKYAALVDVQADWSRGGHAESRHFIISKDVTVGVFFESELLKALGVPSFLLLPGCLFIFAMQLLLAFGWYGLKKDSTIPDLPMTSPGFWIIAVTFSGIFAWVYSWTTKHDYMVRYGVSDIRNVWLLSIALGIVVFAVFGAFTSKKRKLHVPDSGDPPLEILRKMQRNGLGILAGKVQFKMNGVDLKAFLIEKIKDDQTMVWVAPEIEAQWVPEAVEPHKRFNELVQGRAPIADLVQALEDSLTVTPRVTLSWRTENSIPNPYHLKVENIAMYLDPDTVVTVT